MTDTPNFRALCAELFYALSAYDECDDEEEVSQHWNYTNCNELLHRARTDLATPPPQPPTDEERLADFTKWLAREMPPNTIIGDPLWWAPRIWRAALERWGHR